LKVLLETSINHFNRGFKTVPMQLNLNREIRIWSIYFSTLFLAIYIHELGHCIPAWMDGVRAIPTPAKEYINQVIPPGLQEQVSLGGIIGTVLFTVLTTCFFLLKDYKHGSAILAGALAMPGVYLFRFLIVGRGHDATEFQEAQDALGFSYSGHSIDYAMLILFLSGGLIWLAHTKPSFKIAGRLVLGFILTLIFVVTLQTLNNAIFDPLFQS
jgi:hypothetical protein